MRYDKQTGEVRPRRRPVNWSFVRSVLREGQGERRFLKEGFEEVHEFSAFPNSESNGGGRIVAVRHNRAGDRIFVKVRGRSVWRN